MNQVKRQNNLRFFLVAFVVVSAASATVAVCFGVLGKRRAAGEATCLGNMKKICVFMHQYHEKYKHFPPAYLTDKAGKPAHSWRMLLLEFSHQELYQAYDFSEPWDGPNNRKLAKRMPAFYACACDPDGGKSLYTNYVVVTGGDTVFPGAKSTRYEDITDVKGSTLMVVEIAEPKIHWMEPRDLDVSTMSFKVNDKQKPSISSLFCRGPAVGFVNAILGRLKEDADVQTIQGMLTIDGKEKIDLKQVLK